MASDQTRGIREGCDIFIEERAMILINEFPQIEKERELVEVVVEG